MLDSKPKDQFLTTARNQSTNSTAKVFRTEPLHGSPLRHPKSSWRPGWRSGCNQLGTHITSVQNAIFWLRNISFSFFDYVIEFQVKSLISNTFKCCRHTQHSRVITPWSHFAQYQPKVRCEALTSWSLSLSLDLPLLGRSLWLLWFGCFLSLLLGLCFSQPTLPHPPIGTKFAVGRCIFTVLQSLQEPQSKFNGKINSWVIKIQWPVLALLKSHITNPYKLPS